jgi:16S rRNA (cytosine1402-N4)-methyltransferase
MTIHTPVLTKEVLQYLNPTENENFIDCTIGEGGHTKLILEKTKPLGKVLGIDLDPGQIETDKWSMADYGDRLILENNSYANLKEIIEKNNFGPVAGILLDIGMSSVQLEGSKKGFSFKAEQVLDMRYDDRFNNLTAEKIINEWPKAEIEKIIKEFGEEKFSRKIADKIVEERSKGRIRTTLQLVEVIKKAIPSAAQKGKIHCATRTFQALRIAVNDELGNLQMVLPQAVEVLAPGGRLAVISFHSLEDRIVKEFFKNNKDIKILTKKPTTAGLSEIGENPRARSAKLRVVVKN